MPKPIYVHPDPTKAHDTNTGLDPKRPKLTLQGAQAIAKPGDRILIRMASVFTTPQTITTSGVIYDVYSLGTEVNRMPRVSLAKGTTTKTTGVLVTGIENIVSHLDVEGADIGYDVASVSGKTPVTGNVLDDIIVARYAWAVRIRGSKTTCEHVHTFTGAMYRDGDKTATGANAFTLWGDEGQTVRDLVFRDCTSTDSFAYSSGLTGKPDGSDFELWGNVENVKVFGHTSRNSGSFCEIGGRVTLANGQPANEAARNVVFEKCLVIDPMGRALYVNDRHGDFPIDISGVSFVECTVKADDDEASPFFVGAGHGSLRGKLNVHGCIVVATSQIYNAGTGTDIASLDHVDNHYYRSDGGTGIGVPLHASETVGDPVFTAASLQDYRLAYNSPQIKRAKDLGALGSSFLPRLGPDTVGLERGAGALHGSYDSVRDWRTLSRIPMALRESGMQRYVEEHRCVYVLARDKKNWLKA